MIQFLKIARFCANHNERNNAMNLSELESKTCNRRKARENARNPKITIGNGFTPDWLKNSVFAVIG